jgi:hypothetical protein
MYMSSESGERRNQLKLLRNLTRTTKNKDDETSFEHFGLFMGRECINEGCQWHQLQWYQVACNILKPLQSHIAYALYDGVYRYGYRGFHGQEMNGN